MINKDSWNAIYEPGAFLNQDLANQEKCLFYKVLTLSETNQPTTNSKQE